MYTHISESPSSANKTKDVIYSQVEQDQDEEEEATIEEATKASMTKKAATNNNANEEYDEDDPEQIYDRVTDLDCSQDGVRLRSISLFFLLSMFFFFFCLSHTQQQQQQTTPTFITISYKIIVSAL